MDNLTDQQRGEARAQVRSIVDLVEALRATEEWPDQVDAAQAIHEDPLELTWQSGDTSSFDEVPEKVGATILLCTGGPAARLVMGLDRHGDPEDVRMEFQDWFTPWARVPVTNHEQTCLDEYASMFVFAC